MQAWARGNFGGLLEHCRQYAEQTGTPLEEALAKFGLEQPEIPAGFEFVWEWFFELAQARSSNGMGWNPLAWTDIAAWGAVSGVKVEPWLARCFMAMDGEWLKAAREQEKAQERKGNNGERNRTQHHNSR